MAATLSLICQIVDEMGELFGTPFSVDASLEGTIEKLRGIIQATKAIPPDLMLWKLLVPQSALLNNKARTNQYISKIEFLDPASDEALGGNGTIQVLDPFETPSTYWKEEPLAKHVHIVVQIVPPPAKYRWNINCQAVHQNKIYDELFVVVVSSKALISQLREAVMMKFNLSFIAGQRLVLWKLLDDLPQSRTESGRLITRSITTKNKRYVDYIEGLTFDDSSRVLQKLEYSTCWEKEPNKMVVHVLVDIPDLSTPKVEFKDVSNEKFIDREEYCKRAVEGDVPSFSARVENFLNAQRDLPILNGRPSENTGPPVGLYHPVFNNFSTAIRSKEPLDPNEETLSLAYHFLDASAKIYNTETMRSEEMHKRMTKLLGSALSVIEAKGVKSDGALITDCLDISAYLAVVEEKVEIGAGGGDPYNQAGFSYRKYWTQDGQKPIRDLCCCPSIILAIAGSWLCVSGAVLLDKVVVQPLTDYIWLGGDPSNIERQHSVIRLFGALKDSIQELRTYYQSLKPQPMTKQPIFPFIEEYETKTFEYKSYLMPLYPDKYIYKGLCNETQQSVVVKFVDTYNAEAHKILAENGMAPELYYVSEKLYGGKRMVVMEYIKGKSPNTLTEAQFEDVKLAIGLLHSRNLVFGDLRQPNVVIVPGKKVHLVDFDWCGIAGTARYPSHPFNDKVQWAEGMGLGCIMEKAHDLAMLEKLKALIKHN